MRLTVRLKNPDESFEPAVNPIPIPDAPGPKLDYDYVQVSIIREKMANVSFPINVVRRSYGLQHTDVGGYSRIRQLDQSGANIHCDRL
jgi:hypothetical protein